MKLNVDMSEGANVSFEYAGQTILFPSGGINDQLSAVLIGSMGIGNLWLNPYRQASVAAFYREVSGKERMESTGAEDASV